MLKEKIEALFEELDSRHALLTPTLFGDERIKKILRKHCGDIITESLQKECNSQEYGPSKEISIGNIMCYKHFVVTRCLRKYSDLLIELVISNPDATQYYEYDPCQESPYIMYIDEYTNQNRLPYEIGIKNRKATVFDYHQQNPKGKLTPVELHSKDGCSQVFNITPNWAPFCKNHFVVFAANNGNSALKQVFHKNETLYWIDDLFSQLNSPDYSLFLNPQGAGHSMDTFHLQLIQSSFPVFENLKRSYPNTTGLIFTDECDWPFKGILARYTPDIKDRVLFSFEEQINFWISNPYNTFNLLYQMNSDGSREFFFVFRQKSLSYVKGISNGIAGYEVGGNIIIEKINEYNNFPDHIEKLEMCEKP